MMDKEQKQKAITRLKKIEGQVRGLQKMVEEDRYCIDIIGQTASVVNALKGVEDLVMEQHLHTCVADAMSSDQNGEKDEKIDEVMQVLKQFRKHG